MLLYLIGVEAVDLCGKRGQLFGSGQVIGDMDTIKASVFQPDDDSPELMVLRKHLCNHLIHLLCATLCVSYRNHLDQEVLVKADGRDNISAGTEAYPSPGYQLQPRVISTGPGEIPCWRLW